MKIYCQKCGSGIEYSFNKPKFCSSCGNSFTSISASPRKDQKNIIPKVTHNLEEEEVERVPDISSLDVEFEVNNQRKEKFGNLLGTRSEEGVSRENVQGQTLNKQEIMESFKKEAGFYPSRQTINEEEE